MKLQLAILGLGSIGMRHARNALTLGHAVRGFDPDPDRRAVLEADGGRAFDTVEGALDGAFAAVIASPSGLHLEDMQRCIDAGVHMLVEKPLAHVISAAEPVVANAGASGLTVAVGLNTRFRPVLRVAHDILRSDDLGDVLWARFTAASYLPDWRPGQDYRWGYANDPVSGGVIFDAVHEFDLANHLLGPAHCVAASAGKSGLLELDSEDTADVILAHEGGHRSILHLDYVTRPKRRGFEVAGTKGMIAVDLFTRHYVHWGADGTILADRDVPSDFNDEYTEELKDFVFAAETGSAPSCPAVEALDVLRQVCDARAMCGLPSAE